MAHVILSNGETVDCENPQVEVPMGAEDLVSVEMGETESVRVVVTAPEGAEGKVLLIQGEETAEITQDKTLVFVNGGVVTTFTDYKAMITVAIAVGSRFTEADLDALKALISS